MAHSQCQKCENRYFEIVSYTPAGGIYKLGFVQCSKCGSVVGAMDYYNIGTLIKELEQKIDKKIGNQGGASLSNISGNLNTINHNITSLFRLIESTNTKLEKIEDKLKEKE